MDASAGRCRCRRRSSSDGRERGQLPPPLPPCHASRPCHAARWCLRSAPRCLFSLSCFLNCEISSAMRTSGGLCREFPPLNPPCKRFQCDFCALYLHSFCRL